MEPDNVAAEVRQATEDCRAIGGRPNADAMLKVDDLNGDGGEDWIVDFSKLRCAGATNPFCGRGGCSLQIFLWTGGSEGTRVFDEIVQSYRLTRVNGRRAVAINMGGSACGKPNYQTCAKTYSIERTRLAPLR